ncbi:MAG: hypothetical protein IJL92_04485 [Thermoguttaceae bacterium]|nr:hypothetical protein [Thermoguttaceae bacterium]
MNIFDTLFDKLTPTDKAALTAALGWFASIEREYSQKENAAVDERKASSEEKPFQTDYAAKLRRAIVRDVWEPDLRAELVDRCVNLVATKRVTLSELKKAIAEAKEKRRQYELTGGKSGAESIWKPLGAWCRGRYEAEGLVWTKTDKLLEPEPPRLRPAPLRAVDVHGNPVE